MAPADVLVTGSSGHLGHALMLELPKYGYTPLGLDIAPSEHSNTIVGSISDRALLRHLFATTPSLRHVLHTAALHKPHIGSHGKQAFIDTNITGTLTLLQEAAAAAATASAVADRQPTARIQAFVFTSTTSTFGSALTSPPGHPALWIDESVTPIPKNIYGVTKLAAEELCALMHAETHMPILVLKTSRFFPERDDDVTVREAYDTDTDTDDNLKINELLHRRADLGDVVSAHVQALRRAPELLWGTYIISAPTPFARSEALLRALDGRAADAIRESVAPRSVEILSRIMKGEERKRGWRLPERLDRVYDSSKAVRELEWRPEFTFERALEMVGEGRDYRSEVARKVGRRGYHDVPMGVYTA